MLMSKVKIVFKIVFYLVYVPLRKLIKFLFDMQFKAHVKIKNRLKI